jgi:hypothetical protein
MKNMQFNVPDIEKENLIPQHEDGLIKLQGSVFGPQNDLDFDTYLQVRITSVQSGKDLWIARNIDSDGRAWDFVHKFKDTGLIESLGTVVTDDWSIEGFEGYAGNEGQFGSGLVSVSLAIEFVESHPYTIEQISTRG